MVVPGLLACIFPYLLLGNYGRFFLPFFTRLFVFWLVVAFSSWLINSWRSGIGPLVLINMTAVTFAVLYRLAQFMADLGTYPFSLGWSEASRYYYASLFFSERIYGISIPPSILHPTRYLIQSIPFLIPGAGLAVHRVWQVAVWVILSGITGIILGRRIGLSRWKMILPFSLWVFLFLFQGPVYYHLLVMVVLVVWACRSTQGWWTLFIVGLASIWAGMSRVNWIPVPGMLAAMLYFLEKRRGTEKPL